MEPRRRLLAMDLDGTLLRSDLTVSPANEAAVATFLAAGPNHVALATGRVHRAAAKYAAHWPGHAIWVIAGNGSVVRPADGGAPIYERSVRHHLAAELIAWAHANGVNLKSYIDDEMWVTTHRDSSAAFCANRGLVYHVEPDLATKLPKSPTKLVLDEEPSRVDQIEAWAREQFGDELSIIRSEPQYLEFMDQGVTKGTALAFLANHLGVAQAETAAIGNERNDLAMIEWAGYGGVVGNAVAPVRERAPRVMPHHDEDGVAAFIKEWISR